jgi:hypothetical protein
MFRGTLTPALMLEDLAFAPAAESVPFRERIVRW